eukprot:scaffold248024_cov31-Tisochrysis_lutea.AAC.1
MPLGSFELLASNKIRSDEETLGEVFNGDAYYSEKAPPDDPEFTWVPRKEQVTTTESISPLTRRPDSCQARVHLRLTDVGDLYLLHLMASHFDGWTCRTGMRRTSAMSPSILATCRKLRAMNDLHANLSSRQAPNTFVQNLLEHRIWFASNTNELCPCPI